MTNKLPAIQFYPGDWRKDPGIMPLDLAHRGLWFELLLLMHESPQRGVLLTANGTPMPMTMVAAMFRMDGQTITGMVEVLIEYGVASRRDTDGALINRRMIRDDQGRAEMIQNRRAAGKRGALARWGAGAPEKPDGKCHIPAIPLPSVCHDSDMAKHGSSSSPSTTTSPAVFLRSDENAADETPTIRFGMWWKSYPMRNGKRGNRGEAWSEWRKLTPPHWDDIEAATANLAAACAAGDTMPKDAQRFLRTPNKRAGADLAYVEWVAIDTRSKQRPNDSKSIDNGVLAKLSRKTAT